MIKKAAISTFKFSTGYFIREIEMKHFPPCSHTYRLEIAWNTRPAGSYCHFNFSFSHISTHVSITVWKHGKYFLLLNCVTALAKGKFFEYLEASKISKRLYTQFTLTQFMRGFFLRENKNYLSILHRSRCLSSFILWQSKFASKRLCNLGCSWNMNIL